MEANLTWGGDDVLWNCAPETCIILLTSVTPVNSKKQGKKEQKNQS